MSRDLAYFYVSVGSHWAGLFLSKMKESRVERKRRDEDDKKYHDIMASCSLKFFMKFTVTRFSSRFSSPFSRRSFYTFTALLSLVCRLLGNIKWPNEANKKRWQWENFPNDFVAFWSDLQCCREVSESHQIDSCRPEQWAVHSTEKLNEFSLRSSFETTITSHFSSFSRRDVIYDGLRCRVCPSLERWSDT